MSPSTAALVHRRHLVALVVLVGLLAVLPVVAPAAPAAPAPPATSRRGPQATDLAPGSVLVPCSQAAVRVQVTADRHLDPTCTYTAGFDLTASNTTLDCQGARIAGPVGPPGIVVSSPIDTPLDHVTVRNCRLDGYMNGIKVTRPGFITLAAGVEYVNGLSDITIEDNEVTGAHGVGIYVDGYVTGVTIRRNDIHGNGSTGVYLDTGSKDNVVDSNDIVGNGFRENGAAGTATVVNGVSVRYWGPGREGLAVDGSLFNRIVGNRFEGNAAGSIFLYKNCGEYYITHAASWLPRRYGANGNLIEGNTFTGGLHGVWVGARMGENTWPMECSAAAYIDNPLERYVEDEATDNVVRGNTFTDVTYGVHVEDDRTTVEDNTFTAADATHHAVILGTRQRTEVLGHPVTGTVVRGNASTIAGNRDPYRWADGEAATTASGNTALGQPVGLCEAPTVPHNPMVMVIAFALEDPNGPPAPTPDLTVKTLGALAACTDAAPTTTTTTSTTTTSTTVPGGAASAATPVGAVTATPVAATPAFTG